MSVGHRLRVGVGRRPQIKSARRGATCRQPSVREPFCPRVFTAWKGSATQSKSCCATNPPEPGPMADKYDWIRLQTMNIASLRFYRLMTWLICRHRTVGHAWRHWNGHRHDQVAQGPKTPHVSQGTCAVFLPYPQKLRHHLRQNDPLKIYSRTRPAHFAQL